MKPARQQPHFRFFPTAYEHPDVLVEDNTPCPICREAAGWKYVGTIYASEEIAACCAACIAEGRLLDLLGAGEVALHDAELTGAEDALADEILYRTPGFATFNAFEWPVHRGEPLAFIGHGDNPSFSANTEARAAIRKAGAEIGARDWDYPTAYALIFRGLEDGRYFAVADLD